MVRSRHTRLASRSVLGKRRRTGFAARPYKRRRFNGKRSTNFTSQSAIGGGIRFRSRKLSRSAWRRMLWNNTLQKDHYRSITAASTTFNTPATSVTLTVNAIAALRMSGSFYLAPGGAISPDGVQPLPTFTGKVVIRGGTLGCRLVNQFDSVAAQQNTLHGYVYLVKTSKAYISANIPATIPVGWDPSYIQDFSTYIGRIVYRKQFLLRDAESALVEYRLKCHSIDIDDYVNNKNTYVWIIACGNLDGTSPRACYATYYYNLSFSADAV